MAAQIPSRTDPEANERALAAARADKERETSDGFDGTWVTHPDTVATATAAFDAVLGDRTNAEAGAEVVALAEAAGIAVVTTLMAKGVVPESHPLNFGCPGMHGGKWANWALNMCDLMIAVGARFDDRVTGRVEEFAPAAEVAHFDVDPGEIGKIRHADFPVLGELRGALSRTLAALSKPALSCARRAQVRVWRERFPLRYDRAAPALRDEDGAQGRRRPRCCPGRTGIRSTPRWRTSRTSVERVRVAVAQRRGW